MLKPLRVDFFGRLLPSTTVYVGLGAVDEGSHAVRRGFNVELQTYDIPVDRERLILCSFGLSQA
jgi:hypothetical protein